VLQPPAEEFPEDVCPLSWNVVCHEYEHVTTTVRSDDTARR